MNKFFNKNQLVKYWHELWILLVWLLLWGNINLANILGGTIIGILIMKILPLPKIPIKGKVDPIMLTKLVIVFFWKLIVSSIQVTWITYKTPGAPSKIIKIPYSLSSDLILSVYINYINLIPGTIIIRIDRNRKLNHVHVLDVSTRKKIQDFYKEMFTLERMFILCFEKDGTWKKLNLKNNFHNYHNALTSLKKEFYDN